MQDTQMTMHVAEGVIRESLVSRALACTALTEFGEKYRRLLSVESDRDHLCG